MGKSTKMIAPALICKDKNIGNHRYIGSSILQIYRKYINGYFEIFSLSKEIDDSSKSIRLNQNKLSSTRGKIFPSF